MRCILMNKNTPVLEAEYMSGVGVFTNIYALYNTDYMPYHLCVSCVELSEWFKNRGIPSYRYRLDLLMHRLNDPYNKLYILQSFVHYNSFL